MPKYFRKSLEFLQMPRQFWNFLNCLGISGIAWSFPEMTDFRNCLRHTYKPKPSESNVDHWNRNK